MAHKKILNARCQTVKILFRFNICEDKRWKFSWHKKRFRIYSTMKLKMKVDIVTTLCSCAEKRQMWAIWTEWKLLLLFIVSLYIFQIVHDTSINSKSPDLYHLWNIHLSYRPVTYEHQKYIQTFKRQWYIGNKHIGKVQKKKKYIYIYSLGRHLNNKYVKKQKYNPNCLPNRKSNIASGKWLWGQWWLNRSRYWLWHRWNWISLFTFFISTGRPDLYIIIWVQNIENYLPL